MTGMTTKAGAVSPNESGSGRPALTQTGRDPTIIRTGTLGPVKTRPVGFALRAGLPIGGEDGYDIVALDAGGAMLLAFGPFPEADVVAMWRALGEASGLPLLIEHGGGDLRPACDQIGRLRLGRTRMRRRHAVLAGRRPRFLARRKPGRAPRKARVHFETEIGARRER